MKAARKLRRLQHPQSLMEHLRQFLTPQVWKQARQAVPRGRSLPRWDLQPLVREHSEKVGRVEMAGLLTRPTAFLTISTSSNHPD